MVDIITVTQIIKQEDYAIQLDLVDAYHHLKVSEDFAETYQYFVHGLYIPLYGPTIWLELKTNAFLQGDQANRQNDQSEVLRQRAKINRRSIDLIIGKEPTRVRHSSDNSIHEGAAQNVVAIQIQSNTNVNVSIPWLDVEYLFEDNTYSSVQEKVIEIKYEKMVRDYDGEEGCRGQEISAATIRVELFMTANNRHIFLYIISINRVKTEAIKNKNGTG
ncbi:MAG: hypothetical protein EZS28_011891 [Streblomastix strix]|uniref:Uncharacterized protein n=1 Tax=Streblomastix strix TaxID=222440 RepID=A0A5J4WCB5_9EUKA|nr:MAG: hypothetical protein EZS28_011891 [Streblomastix strix]